MSQRRNEKTREVPINIRRKLNEAAARKREELVENILLGLDDGTTEAALNEEVGWDKFFDDDEPIVENVKPRRRRIDAAQYVHDEQLKFHKNRVGHKVNFRG